MRKPDAGRAQHPARVALLALPTLALSWYAMMLVHELGHTLAAWAIRAPVHRVVVPLLGFSRTDHVSAASNAAECFVLWSGPLFGALAPIAVYAALRATRRGPGAGLTLLHFFAGFALAANGAYLLGTALADASGADGTELAQRGAPHWILGALALPLLAGGFICWNGQWPAFRAAAKPRVIAVLWVVLLALLVVLALVAQEPRP